MNYDYYRMKEKNRNRIERMYRRRCEGLMTREQFYSGIDRMIHKEEIAARQDHYGTGFLADLATDSLRASGLNESDDLWSWISKTFRIQWSEWYDNDRLKNAVRLACIRVFYKEDRQARSAGDFAWLRIQGRNSIMRRNNAPEGPEWAVSAVLN